MAHHRRTVHIIAKATEHGYLAHCGYMTEKNRNQGGRVRHSICEETERGLHGDNLHPECEKAFQRSVLTHWPEYTEENITTIGQDTIALSSWPLLQWTETVTISTVPMTHPRNRRN